MPWTSLDIQIRTLLLSNCEWYIRYACAARRRARCECTTEAGEIVATNWRWRVQSEYTLRVYSDWTRQRQFDGVKHNVLVLEHMLFNQSIHTARVASKFLYNRDAVDLTLACPDWIDPKMRTANAVAMRSAFCNWRNLVWCATPLTLLYLVLL